MRTKALDTDSELSERDPIISGDARLAMIRQVKAASIERRVEMFERLCADAAWIRRHAVRIK